MIEVKQGPFSKSEDKFKFTINENKLKFIPVNVPKLYKQEKLMLLNVLKLIGFHQKENLSKPILQNSIKYGIAVSSGTAALEIAVKSLNLKLKLSFQLFQ